MSDKEELETELKEIELMISLIHKYINQKDLIKSTKRCISKVIRLAKIESSNRKRILTKLSEQPRVIDMDGKDDVFYRKLVVSGGAFGMSKK